MKGRVKGRKGKSCMSNDQTYCFRVDWREKRKSRSSEGMSDCLRSQVS